MDSLDLFVLAWCQSHNGPRLHAVMTALSFCGSAATLSVLAALACLFFLYKKRSKEAWVVLGGTALGLVFITPLKRLFHHARPVLESNHALQSFSFPSGHAQGSIVFFLLLAWSFSQLYPKRRMSLYLVACGIILSIGASRIFLGAHWVRDVMGGYFFGALVVATLVGAVSRPWQDRIR